MTTTLEEVKQVEKEAEKLIWGARRQREKIIAEARVKSSRFVREKEEELGEKKAQTLEKEKERILAAKEKLQAEGLDKLKSIRRAAEKKLDEAVEIVMAAFDKEISGE